MAKLLAFLGESFEESILEDYNKSSTKGIGDPKVINTSSIHSDSIGRWKKNITGDKLKYATKELKPLIKNLGYNLK